MSSPTTRDRLSDPTPPTGAAHTSSGEVGFDGRSEVYDELARILIEEAERREREAKAS